MSAAADRLERGRMYRVVAEVASAITVALTLVFVGLQVRETARQTALNTEAMRVSAYQDLTTQINQFNQYLLDPGVAAVFETMQSSDGDWSAFSTVERRQARALLFLLVRHADMAYYQFERGLLPQDRLDSALMPFLTDANKPLFRAFWEEVKHGRPSAFIEYIDRRIAEAGR